VREAKLASKYECTHLISTLTGKLEREDNITNLNPTSGGGTYPISTS